MKLTPVRNAVLGYAEWCCAYNRAWPKLRVVAADLARNLSEVERAFQYLEDQGVVSVRFAGLGHVKILRLWDGRETVFCTPDIHSIHRRVQQQNDGIIDVLKVRRAA